jgi:predicted DCC family thiol-disulfide oxidoreductase YuxK
MILFYDGHCAMCNRAVLFVLQRDPAARFTPLQGTLAQSNLPKNLPDTMIVQTDEGSLLIRSDAWVYILSRLSGPWKTLGCVLGLVPRPVRDGGYRIVARFRKAFRPKTCRIIPLEFKNRFSP